MNIKINFEITGKYGTFRDCIVLPADHNISQSDIELMKQKRYSDWVELVDLVKDGEE
jgi:hypothetical protein